MKLAIIALILLLVAMATILVISRRAPSVATGHEGGMQPCPGKPNCVSSRTSELGPLRYAVTDSEAERALRAVMKSRPRTNLITDNPNYLHYTETSLLFRFVDDLEFWFEPERSEIHYRSASRVGYSDLGVNQTRIEEIREAFQEQLAAGPTDTR